MSETCSGVVVNKGNVLKAKVTPEVNITSGIDFDSSHFDYKKADLICQGEPIADTKVRIMEMSADYEAEQRGTERQSSNT